MSEDRFDARPFATPLDELERSLIDQYIRLQGHEPSAVASLPQEERHRLLAQASIHASCKLGEVEARSHYIHGIHHTTSDVFKSSE